MSGDNCPFFMTHHAPMGAWSSFTFGLPGRGCGIEHETAAVNLRADLLAAISRDGRPPRALPFSSAYKGADYEAQQAGTAGGDWSFIPESRLHRRLSACVDEFAGEDLLLRVYSPMPTLPFTEGDLEAFAACPGLLLDFEVDNRGSDQPARGFLGVRWLEAGVRIHPLDWSSGGELCGVGYRGQWALAARPQGDATYTLRDNSVAAHLAAGQRILHNGGGEGGICFAVPAGKRQRITLAMGFWHDGPATEGIDTRYLFNRYFRDVEDVCRYVLDHAQRFRDESDGFDADIQRRCGDADRRLIFAQAARAYAANTQLTQSAEGCRWYSVCEGQFCWRNTLDLAVDQLPYELWRQPAAARNIIDSFLERYSYVDQIRFGPAGEPVEGGLSFCHDQGNYTAYSPAGHSGYEMPDLHGCYSFMTTEELLNGVYCLAGVALCDSSPEWLMRRADFVEQLLTSMERRDNVDPARRDGLMKADSCRCGTGREITTYDALDPSLKLAAGNLYLAVKTWCAALLLEACFTRAGNLAAAARAGQYARRTSRMLVAHFDTTAEAFAANLLDGSDNRIIVAIEPLALPWMCGLAEQMRANGELLDCLRRHALTCLRPGVCLDAATGGLRLSAASTNTWPSKTAQCLFVLEKLGIDLRRYPSIMAELLHWTQVSAASITLADQIDSSTRRACGGAYYPRAVTAALWLAGDQPARERFHAVKKVEKQRSSRDSGPREH